MSPLFAAARRGSRFVLAPSSIALWVTVSGLCSAPAFAQSSFIENRSETRIESRPEARSIAPRAEKSDEFSVGFATESLLTRERPKGGVADEQRLTVRARSTSDLSSSFGASIDLGGSSATGTGRETMEEVPEAYVRWTTAPLAKDRTMLVVGRKLETWSRLDRDWTLGEWQPLNRFDALRPTEQGLTGAFAEVKNGGFELIAFASPIFLPEQGPGYQLQNGRFESANPWFAEPTDQLVMFSKPTTMHYTIEMPTTDSVINHPEGGLMLRFGDLNRPGAGVQLAYAKKPRNQVGLPFDGMLDINKNEAAIALKPVVEYHDLASLDATMRTQFANAPVAFNFSALYDVSNDTEMPAGSTYQRLAPLLMLSPSIEARLESNHWWGPRVKVSALHSIGGEATVMGPLATATSPFAPSTMYREAISLEAHSRVWQSGAGWKLETGFKWIEELEEKGRIVMADLSLADRGTWRVAGFFDVLTSQLPADVNPGFISRFRGNDRIGTSVQYYF
jgi:hypothetical protein